MAVRLRILAIGVAMSALICALPARALASSSPESILMDDKQLIYSSPEQVAWTLEQARRLGIDRLKVSVVWVLVAPHPNARTRPHFDASDPAAYPYGAWARYDRIVTYAHQLGFKVYFQLVPPAPVWAEAKGKPTQGYPWSHNPSPSDFGQFVAAVGKRYGGSYVPQNANDRPRAALKLPFTLPGVSAHPAAVAPSASLPQVNYWGIWNEPNEGAWLNPQWRVVGHGHNHHLYYVAPALYRTLVDTAYSALKATGHSRDTILTGEIASHGWIYPLPFVRALYCVGADDLPLKGAAARNLKCPSSGSRSAFVAHHPGLFATTGFAHHPYSFDTPPNRRMPDRSLITLANLGQLESTLGRIFNAYHRHRGGGVPLYLTEWGYKTDPPNPFVRTSLNEQATWLNQGEYMTYRDSYVRGLAQFLLVDDDPRSGEAVGSRAYWGTFQTGLLFANEKPKPSYGAFQIPIWLPDAHHGARVTLWGELRPADHAAAQSAEVQFQRRGSGNWSNVTAVQTDNREGFLTAHVRLPSAGQVRLAWTDPSGAVDYSRSAAVS